MTLPATRTATWWCYQTDGQARTIDPADVVSNRVFCILLNDAGEEVREVEADCPKPEPAP